MSVILPVAIEDDDGYTFETPDALDDRIAALEERVRDARAEADHARGVPGLDGAVAAAESEVERGEAELADLQHVRERVARGYPYWERFGLEAALEASGEPWRWDVLSETVAGSYVFGQEGTDIRLPLEAQQAYRHAVESGLFERFEICSHFDTDGDDVVRTTYYLVGVHQLATLGAALFFVTQWVR